ncbi:DUF1768-domain-containing protein [Atractiella rhizophila]|nr:DUF1768-domain-containing protein [Atractiella rhizophila]
MPLEFFDPSFSQEQVQAVRRQPLFSKSFFSLKTKKYYAPDVEQNIPVMLPPPEYVYVPLPKPEPVFAYEPAPPSSVPSGYRAAVSPRSQTMDHMDGLEDLFREGDNVEDVLAGLRGDNGRSAEETAARLQELKNRLNRDEELYSNLRERIQSQSQSQTQSNPSQRRAPSMRAPPPPPSMPPMPRRGTVPAPRSTRSGSSLPAYSSPDFKLPPLPSSDGRTAMPPLPSSDGRTMYARTEANWADDLRSAPPTEIGEPRKRAAPLFPAGRGAAGKGSAVKSNDDDEIWFSDDPTDPRFELSNDFVCDIDLGHGQEFPTLTHLFHSCKFLDESDSEIIRRCRTAGEAGAMAAKLKSRADWRFVQDAIMRGGLAIKFGDPELRAELLDTLGKKLIFDSEDAYWGRGKDGQGFNKLGVFLMELRNRLWQDEKNASTDIVATALQILLALPRLFKLRNPQREHLPKLKQTPKWILQTLGVGGEWEASPKRSLTASKMRFRIPRACSAEKVGSVSMLRRTRRQRRRSPLT